MVFAFALPSSLHDPTLWPCFGARVHLPYVPDAPWDVSLCVFVAPAISSLLIFFSSARFLLTLSALSQTSLSAA